MTRSILISVSILAAAAFPASAQVFHFTADLDGEQEVPPVQTPGWGFASMTLTLEAGVPGGHLVLTGNYYDLLSDVRPGGGGAHIHGPAPVGVNAGVMVTLEHTGGRTGLLSFEGMVNQDVVDAMLIHHTYINVHSDLYPAGEIRGQIIPAPSALALLGVGGLFALRRRR